MKFKVGDRVGWIDHYDVKDEDAYGTIINIDDSEGNYYPYEVSWHDMNDYIEWHDDSQLYHMSVKDTTLARKYYNNKIIDIKDGRIWLR